MKKEDIYKYLLSEDEINDIILKQQVDNSVVEELQKLTPQIQSQKFNQYNINDYNKLVESNRKRDILEFMKRKVEATLSFSFPLAIGLGLCPFTLLLMDYFQISNNKNVIPIYIITILLSLFLFYITYKNNKISKIINDNLKSLGDVNNEE